jgi:hypothetical protein
LVNLYSVTLLTSTEHRKFLTGLCTGSGIVRLHLSSYEPLLASEHEGSQGQALRAAGAPEIISLIGCSTWMNVFIS